MSVLRIEKLINFLKERFEGSKIEINKCFPVASGLRFEFTGGVSLEEMFDHLLRIF